MRVKTLEQLYLLCDDIYLANSKVRIVKFENEGHTTDISMTIHRLTPLAQCEYLYKVLVSAFKKRNVLELTFGSASNIFTIILHMNLDI